MAENSGAGAEKGLGKALFRKIGRTRERVLQKLGNADRTTDSDYDQLVNLFNEQHNVGNHLLKEVKNYMTQVKAMAVASQSMYEAMSESYEGSWKNADKIGPTSEELIAIWGDRLDKLTNDLLTPLTKYTDQFRDVKKKIEKRRRKLVDFDGTRHNVESLESAKKRDETKINKAHEELNAAKNVYETIHNELCEELPALYHSRIPTLCNYFASLVSSEAAFQTDCAKIKTRLAELFESEGAAETAVSRIAAVKKPSNQPPRPPIIQRSIDHGVVDEERQMKTEKVGGGGVGGGGGGVVGENESNDYLMLVEFSGNPTANRIESDSSDDENEERTATGGEGASSPTHFTDSAKRKDRPTDTSTSSGRIGGSNRDLEIAAGHPKPFHSSNSSVESNPRIASRTEGRMESPLTGSQVSIDRKGSKASIEEEHLVLHRADKESKGETPAKTEAASEENGRRSIEGGEGVKEEKRMSVEENVGQRRGSSSASEDEEEKERKNEESKKEEETGGANYLYKVVAIHSYTADDADELSFEKGEIIGILPFEDSSDEQDDGWLFGVKSSTGQKGVFPMNFTSKA